MLRLPHQTLLCLRRVPIRWINTDLESSTEATPDNMKLLVAFAIALFGVASAEPGYGYGYGYGRGYGYGGYRGGYGGYRGYYGKRSADAEADAEPTAATEPGYGYYGHGYGHRAYGHGYGHR